MSDKDSSTLGSYVDAAVGAGQTAYGKITGNTENTVSKISKTHALRDPISTMLHLRTTPVLA